MNTIFSLRPILVALTAASSLVLAWVALAAHDALPAPPADRVTTAVAGAPVPATVQPPVGAVAAPAATAAAELRYPDGSVRPALNGVGATLAPSFTVCVPFAPIVGVERDRHGLQWYVHDNGARSTSFLDARGLPFAAAYLPGEPRPLVD